VGNQVFLVRPKPFKGEALTSYIQRVADANYITPHELWREIADEGARYPQSSMASLIDYIPSSVFNVNKISQMLEINCDTLETLTFKTVLKKMLPKHLSDKELLTKRVLSDCFSDVRRFCPECLKQEPFYKLIWQVKEIAVCPEHQLQLLDKCPSCDRKIKLLAVDSKVGVCPECYFELQHSKLKSAVVTNVEERTYQDWEILIEQSHDKDGIHTNVERDASVRLLYLLNECNKELSKEVIYSKAVNHSVISILFQTARDTKSYTTYTHINTILNLLRVLDVSMDEYTELNVSAEFIESIMNEKVTKKETYSCQAPWCSNFKKPGSLVRTATSKKERENGKVLHYYMYCSSCGIEYALDQEKLVERGHFINKAWGLVKPKLENGMVRRQIALEIGVSEDVVRRCAIFLYANKLLGETVELGLDLPSCPDKEKIRQLISYIKLRKGTKQIRKLFGWTYAEFLYHWFQPEVTIARIRKVIPRPDKKKSKDKNIQLVEETVRYFIKENKGITIKGIGNHLGVCNETLRLWGALELIKKAKAQQRSNRLGERNEKLIAEAEEIIYAYQTKRKKILSNDLYHKLGIQRRVLVREFPEITQHISHLIEQITY